MSVVVTHVILESECDKMVIKKSVSKLKLLICNAPSIFATIFFRTHKKRWEKVAVSGPPEWDSRNSKIATLIPDGSTIIDLGCGAQTLRDHLLPKCEYQPCDLVKSSADVIVCDFNAGLYPQTDRIFTHVVCSGVLEYVRDHQRFLTECSSLGDVLILSYNLRQPRDSKLQRMTNNWVNHFTRSELEQAFHTAGLAANCLDMGDNGEAIFELKRIPSN